ncbi:MAG TPA: hypothetical protein ENN86_04390 [Desulfobacteraceae bacterium]|nr:hypothetical protein [Desulfobacteraceae bacterium]
MAKTVHPIFNAIITCPIWGMILIPFHGNTNRPNTPKKSIGKIAMCRTVLSSNSRKKTNPIKKVIFAGAQALKAIHSTNFTFIITRKKNVLCIVANKSRIARIIPVRCITTP